MLDIPYDLKLNKQSKTIKKKTKDFKNNTLKDKIISIKRTKENKTTLLILVIKSIFETYKF